MTDGGRRINTNKTAAMLTPIPAPVLQRNQAIIIRIIIFFLKKSTLLLCYDNEALGTLRFPNRFRPNTQNGVTVINKSVHNVE